MNKRRRSLTSLNYLCIKFKLMSFWRLAHAFAYIEELEKNSIYDGEVVYALEYKRPRKRKFIVISHKEFIKIYFKLKPIERCFYEIIYINTHCALYFDIEYDKLLNPDNNDMVGFTNFIKLLQKSLLSICKVNSSVFGVPYVADRDVDGALYILDASTLTKFSRHVTLYLHRMIIFSN